MRHPGAERDSGFVLVNALVIVAALAMLATVLLARAEGGRARLAAGLEADQLTLALDAFDALAQTHLARESAPDLVLPALPLARGEVAGQVTDLQGRFNINWLSDPDNLWAAATFERLLRQLALPPQNAEEIRRFLQPGAMGEQERAAWLRLDPPLDPLGGPLLSADQLADLPGLSPRSYARLRPLITALSADSRLNVNSAPPEILMAILPDLPPAALARLVAARAQEPFVSVEAFLIAARLEAALDEEAEEDPEPALLSPDQLTIHSAWFRIDSEARLQRMSARRSGILFRQSSGRRPEQVWQVTWRP